MRLKSTFADFLTNTVNLNKTRLGQLDSSVDALKNFVRDSEWEPKIRGFEEQGSWAHSTIIKPVDQGEYDADLLVLVDPVEGWSAADYVRKLGAIFVEDAVYGEKTRVWDYCVTITYANERKVDLAPCVIDRSYAGMYEVCDRYNDEFDLTSPVEYTSWMREKNGYSGSNSFRKVTRLLKYIRDIKGQFECPSVLLTTLLGNQIHFHDKDTDAFADTPTTLKTVVGRLDDFIQNNEKRPHVWNPKLSTEDFGELWTDKQYEKFRNTIHKYRCLIDAAYVVEGKAASITAWRRVFGDEFAKGDTVLTKSMAEDEGLQKNFFMETAAHLNGLVDYVKTHGLSVLPFGFSRPAYQKRPSWRMAPTISRNLSVTAVWCTGRDSGSGQPISSGQVLAARGGLWFDVAQGDGQALPSGYSVHWRITNTGAVAIAKRAGRGDFYLPNRGHRRWESLEYRGIHMAEAFVIRMVDDTLVAQSDPFYVVLE